MERSPLYYAIRGIVRAIYHTVVTGLILVGFYVFILGVWSLG